MARQSNIQSHTQLQLFNQACDLLGGNRATAQLLGINERNVRYLRAGDRKLHDGYLRDVSAALIKHAQQCRELERQLSPAFSNNLTQRQAERAGKPDTRRYDAHG